MTKIYLEPCIFWQDETYTCGKGAGCTCGEAPRGSPQDRGDADRYYSRTPRPHKVIDGEKQYDLTKAERVEYMRGYYEGEEVKFARNQPYY